LRTLLVDDDGPRAMLAKKLELRSGFVEVGEAADGQAAIDLASDHRLDAIVLGSGLPTFARPTSSRRCAPPPLMRRPSSAAVPSHLVTPR
jgi:CheY-like chemotaxis protein